MARFADGLAVAADPVVAAQDAAREAVARLGGRQPDLALVFATGAPGDALAAAGARAVQLCGARTAIGCTAPGVLSTGGVVTDRSAVVVWLAVLPQVRVRAFHLEVLPGEGGMAVVGLPAPQPDDRVALVLADPWSFPVDGFVERSQRVFGGIPVLGALCGAAGGRGASRLWLGEQTVERGAVGLVLGGAVAAAAAVSQGCRPIGSPMTVTASDGNVVLELAGVPARLKLAQVLADLPPADQALAAVGLQLGLVRDEYADEYAQGDFAVRGITGVDGDRDGLVVGDLVPAGCTVQFQLRDAGAAVADRARALDELREHSGIDTVEAVLAFAAVDRVGLFRAGDDDAAAVLAALAPDALGGVASTGQLGPLAGGNSVHGGALTLLAFGSGAAAERGTLSP